MRCEKCARKLTLEHYDIVSHRLVLTEFDEGGLHFDDEGFAARFLLCKNCWLLLREWLDKEVEPYIEI